jgi:hypothetical protein
VAGELLDKVPKRCGIIRMTEAHRGDAGVSRQLHQGLAGNSKSRMRKTMLRIHE